MSQEKFDALKAFKNGVDDLPFTPTRLVVGTSTPQYTLHTAKQERILFDSTDNVAQLLDTLKSALPELDEGESLSYIDLRFGNKVFYKYTDEE